MRLPRARAAKHVSPILLVGFLGGPSGCAPAARPVERATPPATTLATVPTEAAVEDASPRPPAPLSTESPVSAPERSVHTVTTARGEATICIGARTDLARARVAFGIAGAMSSESYAWIARALDERLSRTLGEGRPFDCGPLTRCYVPNAPPSGVALAELGRGSLSSAPLDFRSRPPRWIERYELAVVQLGLLPPKGTSQGARDGAQEAAWQSAIAGSLPSFGTLAQLATERATLTLVVPTAAQAAAARPGDAAKQNGTAKPAEGATGSDSSHAVAPLERRRVALLRTVPSDNDERAWILFAPATARQRSALSRAVAALTAAAAETNSATSAAASSFALRETPGGLVLLTVAGPPEATLTQLERLSEAFAHLTSANGTVNEAVLGRARAAEPPPIDRACDALVGGAHAPPSESEVLDALRDAAVLTVLELHAPEKPKDPKKPAPPARDFARPLAALHFSNRAFVMSSGDRVVKPVD